MERIKIKPVNAEFFQRLLPFAEQALHICERHGVTPIVYGSLAYFARTRDLSLPIQDIDLLVPEALFPDLTRELSYLNDVTVIHQPWHSIEAFKDDLKIDFDAAEYFLDPRSHAVAIVDICGIHFSILNIEALTSIYQEALNNMPEDKELEEKRAKYTKKLNNLKETPYE